MNWPNQSFRSTSIFSVMYKICLFKLKSTLFQRCYLNVIILISSLLTLLYYIPSVQHGPCYEKNPCFISRNQFRRVSSFHSNKAFQDAFIIFRKNYDFLQYSAQRYLVITSVTSNYSPKLSGPSRTFKPPPLFTVSRSLHTKMHITYYLLCFLKHSSIKIIYSMGIW